MAAPAPAPAAVDALHAPDPQTWDHVVRAAAHCGPSSPPPGGPGCDDGGPAPSVVVAPPAPLPFPLPLAPSHPSPCLVEEPAGGACAMSVLMLHGWTQNAQVFREKTHPFVRKFRAAGARLVYLSAPYLVPASAAGSRDDARAHWYYEDTRPTDDDPLARFRRAHHGWEVAREHIARVWAQHGPFDGVCGFSQGAVVVHQLLRDVEGWRRSGAPPPPGCDTLADHAPRFAVLVCGFPARYGPPLPPPPAACDSDAGGSGSGGSGSGSGGNGGSGEGSGAGSGGGGGDSNEPPPPPPLPLDASGDGPEGEQPLLTTPSLHCVGEGDTTVPPTLQRELAGCFARPAMLLTDKGHAMPQRSGDLAAVVAFARAALLAPPL